jgi:site-specific recombinase XerD
LVTARRSSHVDGEVGVSAQTRGVGLAEVIPWRNPPDWRIRREAPFLGLELHIQFSFRLTYFSSQFQFDSSEILRGDLVKSLSDRLWEYGFPQARSYAKNDTEVLQTDLIEKASSSPIKRQSNPAFAYLGALKQSGRRTMRGVLERIAQIGGLTTETMDWPSLRYEQVLLIKTKLSESGKAPATINKILAAIKGVARECWRMELMSVDTYMRIKDVGRVVGESAQAGRALSSGEVDALFRAIMKDSTDEGLRDGAILSLLYAGGLRRSECASLILADVQDSGEVIAISVLGKRHKPRKVFLDNGGATWLRAYLEIRGQTPGPLFWSSRRGGTLTGRGLTDQAIYCAVCKRAKEAGLPETTPHDLRRTLTGDLMDHGIDLLVVQRILGHSDPKVTARYDRRPERAQSAAARVIHVPSRR